MDSVRLHGSGLLGVAAALGPALLRTGRVVTRELWWLDELCTREMLQDLVLVLGVDDGTHLYVCVCVYVYVCVYTPEKLVLLLLLWRVCLFARS